MSGRLGPRLTKQNESTYNDSSNVGLIFLEAEEKFVADKSQNEWKVQTARQSHKNRSSNSKHVKSHQLGEASSKVDHNERSETSGRGSKRSSSNLPSSNKRPQNSSKESFKRSQSADKKKENFEKQSSSDGNYTENSKNSNFKSAMTFSRLQQISVQDSTDIIRSLANSRSGLDEFLSGNIKPDQMYLIIKILSRLTASDWEANKEHVLFKASTPEFFKKITEFVTILVTDKQSDRRREEMEQFFENLLTFFQAVIVMLPSVAAEHLQVPLRATSMALGNVTEFQNISIKASVLDKMKQLMYDLEVRKKEKEEREKILQEKKVELVYPKPLGSISTVSLYPSPEDIDCCEQSLVSNKIEGSYTDVDHYLDVHFRLLREDFISPLRKGIEEYRISHCNSNTRGKKKVNNIRIYNRVRFLKPTIIADKVGYNICFDPDKRLRVKWESTKRFIFGSLLIFTTDNFKSFFLATVVKRDLDKLDKNREVSIVLCNTGEVSKDLVSKEFLMAESEVYFEPYYNVLKALQKFNSNTFPLKKYIVYVNKKTERPLYTRNGSDVYTISLGNKGINGCKTFKLFEDRSWPSCSELGFNESQRKAFKAALTNDLVVIQGPPGTGKTFLGLKIAGALLENSVIWNFDHKTPILVICFTNHALDQFLEGILENGLTNNLIRIGGRSKSELLHSFNLKERRRAAAFFNPNRNQAALLKDLKEEMSVIFQGIKTLQDNLDHFNKMEGILSLKTLKIVMNELQQNYFRSNDDLLQWLMHGVKTRFQGELISSHEKEAEQLTDGNICEEYEFDLTDVENFSRLKEVLFDNIDFEEPRNSSSFSDSVRIYYCLTFDDIVKKCEEYSTLLQTIPSLEEARDVIQKKMREAKKAHGDLLSIYSHFQELLNNTKIPSQEDTQRLYQVKNLDSLNISERWVLYKSWIEFLIAGNWTLLQNLEERFRKGGERFEETRQYDDLRIVQQADVVGITTTTAARLQAMLRELRPKIVIVEEAAEVLEAHIIASLSVHCQHLILIGDHKQLRPSPADYFIGKNHHLDISLFERFIKNGIGFYTLTTQHRMRPEISRLLVPTIYPILSNHPSTLNRSRILGMDRNVFFMNHNHFEEEVDDIMSKRNVFEARMAMGLARHLLLQGYRPDEITVLTTYNGQMHLLKEEQRRLEISKDLLVTVVDNYQGEENRIIILSLVRSNSQNKIGFLKTDNRVCVALSRARDGLFIFGNMDCLCAESPLWQRIRNSLIDQESFGPSLVLRCETHHNELSQITVDRDWAQVLEGGCSKPCGEKLPCGHKCRSLCHVSKDRHVRYRCSQLCNKPLCADGHLCTKKCYEPCGTCILPMQRTLSCGHTAKMPCCTDYKKLQCKEQVSINFPECNHTVQVECYRKGYKACPEPCLLRLECGHQCTKTCHMDDDPDHIKYMCPKPCSRPVPECTTDGHQCPLACFEECEPCAATVVKTLLCGHTMTVPCIQTEFFCEMPCNLTLPCGHPCGRLCADDCGGCNVKVEKVVPLCGHKVKIECGKTPTKECCEGQCRVRLRCGHKCAKRCKETCSEQDCVELTQLQLSLPCGHSGALVPCNMVNKIFSAGIDSVERERLLQYCMEPCLQMLKCTHRCSGTCGQCMQGRIHKVCDEDCNNTLICGHSCPVPCRQVCPPCQKKCQARCVHTKCPKRCGEPCIPCNEPCEYRCVHSQCKKRCGELCNRKPCTHPCLLLLACSHPCVGFCGEPCPPCKECHPEHFQPFAYTGEEDEPETKWVLLNDCKHVVDAPNLERWLQTEQEGGAEIKLKTCPKCSPTAPNRHIYTTQRYMNMIKSTFTDIQMVKKKLFGIVDEIRSERSKLLNQVKDIPSKTLEGLSDNEEIYRLYLNLQKVLPTINKNRRKDVGFEQLKVLKFMVSYLIAMVQRRYEIWGKLSDKEKKKYTAKVDVLTKALRERDQKISLAEVESFSREQKRIVRFGDLLMLENCDEFQALKSNSDVVKNLETAKTLVNQFSEYSDTLDTNVFEAIQKLKEAIKSNAQISDKERKMIHMAMSTSFHGGSQSQGHWFKCPNGHTYCITECGGAVQEAVCPEKGCKAGIGGHNYRRLPGQQLASEMDGATRPAISPYF